MEAHHANLGRRTLEEIRQKRAAERISKASSGSDLSGMHRSDSGNNVSEIVNTHTQHRTYSHRIRTKSLSRNDWMSVI